MRGRRHVDSRGASSLQNRGGGDRVSPSQCRIVYEWQSHSPPLPFNPERLFLPCTRLVSRRAIVSTWRRSLPRRSPILRRSTSEGTRFSVTSTFFPHSLTFSIAAIHRVGREALLQLPQDLQHKLLTGARQGHFAHLPLLLRGYVLSSSSPAVSSDLLNSILEQHRNAEVTLSCHLDMESSDRDPVVSENGKHKIFFPSFPRMFGYGCFHPKLILIRFPDRLRVCQFSLPQLRSSSHPPI